MSSVSRSKASCPIRTARRGADARAAPRQGDTTHAGGTPTNYVTDLAWVPNPMDVDKSRMGERKAVAVAVGKAARVAAASPVRHTSRPRRPGRRRATIRAGDVDVGMGVPVLPTAPYSRRMAPHRPMWAQGTPG